MNDQSKPAKVRLTDGLGAGVPTKEGFYWATTIRRNASKTKRHDYGQVGGLRWIVRLFRYNEHEQLRVQVFGDEKLGDLRDYKDWEGPIGSPHMVGSMNDTA